MTPLLLVAQLALATTGSPQTSQVHLLPRGILELAPEEGVAAKPGPPSDTPSPAVSAPPDAPAAEQPAPGGPPDEKSGATPAPPPPPDPKSSGPEPSAMDVRRLTELFAGALGEAGLGTVGYLTGVPLVLQGFCLGCNSDSSKLLLGIGLMWLGFGGGAGLGAGLSGMFLSGVENALPYALAGGLMGAMAGFVPLLVIQGPAGALVALLFPLVGAVVGAELAQPPSNPASEAVSRKGVMPRVMPSVSVARGGAGNVAVYGLAGTF